jgi:hypothetical protein
MSWSPSWTASRSISGQLTTWSWTQGPHGDLVVATALALWLAVGRPSGRFEVGTLQNWFARGSANRQPSSPKTRAVRRHPTTGQRCLYPVFLDSARPPRRSWKSTCPPRSDGRFPGEPFPAPVDALTADAEGVRQIPEPDPPRANGVVNLLVGAFGLCHWHFPLCAFTPSAPGGAARRRPARPCAGQ